MHSKRVSVGNSISLKRRYPWHEPAWIYRKRKSTLNAIIRPFIGKEATLLVCDLYEMSYPDRNMRAKSSPFLNCRDDEFRECRLLLSEKLSLEGIAIKTHRMSLTKSMSSNATMELQAPNVPYVLFAKDALPLDITVKPNWESSF